MASGWISMNRSDLSAILPFGLVAGAGWIVDFAILFLAVQLGGLPIGPSNFASSLTAAALVYAVSHHWVHDGRRDAFNLRLGAYLIYTVALILLASMVLGLIVSTIAPWTTPAVGVVAGKVLITPPQFLLNFWMSRHLATRARALP